MSHTEMREIDGRVHIVLNGGIGDDALAELQRQEFEGVTFRYGDFGDFSWLFPYAPRITALEFQVPVKSAAFISRFPRLTRLGVCEDRSDLDLSALPLLENLSIHWNKQYDTAMLGKPPLRKVTFTACPLTDLTALESARKLVHCTVLGGTLTSLAGLAKLPVIESVDIRYCRKLVDISSLANASSVKNVALSNLPALKSVCPLVQMPNVESIVLESLTSVQDHAALLGIATLKILSLREINKNAPMPITLDANLLPRIEWLQLTNPILQPDWEQLAAHPTLKTIWLAYTGGEVDPFDQMQSVASRFGKKLIRDGGKHRRGAKCFLSVELME